MAKSPKKIMSTSTSQYKKSQKQWRKKTGLPVNKSKNFYDKYNPPKSTYKPKKSTQIKTASLIKAAQADNEVNTSNNNGCYIATCVYGSYDCPQVWTLRRFRDYTLDSTWYGRAFIKSYYAVSPTLVKWFGQTNWFKTFWKSYLDKMVAKLNNQGIENTQYKDRY